MEELQGGRKTLMGAMNRFIILVVEMVSWVYAYV